MAAREYVLRIASRDLAHPLAETLILEFGVDARNSAGLVGAVASFAELLKLLKTPEKVAEFMRDNAVLANENLLLKER